MPGKHLMDFRSNVFFGLITVLISSTLLVGCISLRFFKAVEGCEVVRPGDEIRVGSTTLEQALSLLGAPDKLAELKGKDLLVYERAVLRQNRISLGIPVGDIWGASPDLSSYGTLVRYDTLALFFTPDGVLQDMVFEQGSSSSYLKTIFAQE